MGFVEDDGQYGREKIVVESWREVGIPARSRRRVKLWETQLLSGSNSDIATKLKSNLSV